MSQQIVLFTAPNCSWCSKAKNFFKHHKIYFKTIDISKNIKAKQDCEAHGCRGVPVVLIGSRWICGFDEKKIKNILGL